MLYFENDYCEGAHEAILKRIMETNMEKVPGYGQDPFCDKAKEKIKRGMWLSRWGGLFPGRGYPDKCSGDRVRVEPV